MASSLFPQNPLSQINPQMLNGIKNMFGMMKAAQNPQQALMQMAGSNQKVKEVLDMVGNNDPKTVFYDKCKQMGVNPNDILNMLK